MKTLSLSAAIATAVIAVSAFSGSANAATPSFNCNWAKIATEHAICDSHRLAKLDRKLAYWYGKALQRAGYFGQTKWLKSQQKNWLWERNSCGWDAGCIADQYRWRIQELRDYAEHV